MDGGAKRRAGSFARQIRAPQRAGGAAQGRGIASQIRQIGSSQQRHGSPVAGAHGAGRSAAVPRERRRGPDEGKAPPRGTGAVRPPACAAHHRRSSMNWCYTYASQYPFWGNAMPGEVARASRALAVGNAEQAASRSKAAGRRREPSLVSTSIERQTQLKRLIFDSSIVATRFCDEENLSADKPSVDAGSKPRKGGHGIEHQREEAIAARKDQQRARLSASADAHIICVVGRTESTSAIHG